MVTAEVPPCHDRVEYAYASRGDGLTVSPSAPTETK